MGVEGRPAGLVVDWFSRHAAEFAAQYSSERMFREREALWTSLVLATCPPDGRVIDVGCGPGALTVLTAPLAREILAVDPSRRMLDLSARRCAEAGIQNCVLAQRRLESLTVDEIGLFDLVLCSSVLEYIDDLSGSLQTLASLVAKGGTLIVSLPNCGSMVRKAEKVAFALSGRPTYYRLVRHVPLRSEVAAILESNSLMLQSTHFYGVPPAVGWVTDVFRLRRLVATMTAFVATRE
jgi:2-polyprenyl-3-methyl-5-hydroxy-6-metoxy-1,4-benzoquinol methylase